MNFEIAAVISVTLILFSVIDIMGSIPVIISLKEKGSLIQAGKATIVSGVIMLIFLLTGERFLGFFGVDVESFAIAGGIIMFLMGLEMVLGMVLFRDQYAEGGKSTIMPVAFPLIAGAGTITTIISLKSEYEELSIFLGIILNLIVVYIVLKSSGWIQRKIGKSGAYLLRKVFGIILLAIGIKLIKNNLNLHVVISQ